MELTGTSAVITGGGNGIGRAIAIALAREGTNVAVADVERDAAESVAGEVEALGVHAVAAQVDVAREEDIEGLADEAWSAFGSVELLFNNAGVGVSVFCPGWVATSIWRSSERRPEHLGGPQEANPAAGRMSAENAMSADEAAAMVLQQIREDRFYLLTHPHVIEYARTRWEDVEAAFAEQAPRYEGDDKYDVVKAIARIRAERQ